MHTRLKTELAATSHLTLEVSGFRTFLYQRDLRVSKLGKIL